MSESFTETLRIFGKTYYISVGRRLVGKTYAYTTLLELVEGRTPRQILDTDIRTIPTAIFPPDDIMTEKYSNDWHQKDRVRYLAVKALGNMKRGTVNKREAIQSAYHESTRNNTVLDDADKITNDHWNEARTTGRGKVRKTRGRRTGRHIRTKRRRTQNKRRRY